MIQSMSNEQNPELCMINATFFGAASLDPSLQRLARVWWDVAAAVSKRLQLAAAAVVVIDVCVCWSSVTMTDEHGCDRPPATPPPRCIPVLASTSSTSQY
jgi:hypothetical protein